MNFLDQAVAADLPSGYGMVLLQAVLALVAVCLLAWVVLRWAAKLGVGRVSKSGDIEVLERVALDARRSIFLVRVRDQVLLLGVGDGAAPSFLGELEEKDETNFDA